MGESCDSMVRLSSRVWPLRESDVRQTIEDQEIVFGALAAPQRYGLGACRTLPAAGDGLPAIRTSAIGHAILGTIVPGTADHSAPALWARGACPTGKDIALADVMPSDSAGDGAGAMQRFRRCARLILQLEIGMKGGEVQRHVRPEMFENPFRELTCLGRIVVERRDHEVGNLEPDIRLVLEPLQGVEHGLEMSERDLPVKVFGERFQIDVGRVHIIVDIVEGLARDVAVADHHSSQTSFPGGAANVHDVFAPNRRLVIGKRDRRTAVTQRELRHIFGGNMGGVDLIAAGFGDVPILAEETAHVAAGCAQRKDLCAGEKMIQRLFFNGINLQGRGGRIAQAIKLASLVDPNKTEAALPLADMTVPRTEIAVHAPVWLRFPPASLVQVAFFSQNLQVLHELLGGCPLLYLLRISKNGSYICHLVKDISHKDLGPPFASGPAFFLMRWHFASAASCVHH